MTQLVINLLEPASVRMGRQVLASLDGEDWPNPTTSGASVNRSGGQGGGSASASADDTPPWEDQGSSQTASNDADDDPWAASASGSSGSAGGNSGRSRAKCADMEAGVSFPKSGKYDKATQSGFQVWEFDHSRAPKCEGGHTAAKVTGYKGKDSARGKPDYTAWWCPVGFAKDWKNKCEFSEWTK